MSVQTDIPAWEDSTIVDSQSPPRRAESDRPRRRKKLINWDHVLVHVGLILVCVGFALPFVWMVSTSLKTNDQAMAFPPKFIPHPFVPRNYVDVLNNPKVDFPLFGKNTLILAFLCVAGTTISSAFVAYGFARIRFRGRGVLFALMLSTMMIPFPVTMASLFVLYKYIGDYTHFQMLGTFRPLWIPAWFGSAFNIFLLRQFFMTLPDELSEAARIDGCSELGIFLRIVLPLAKPALSVVALFTFMGVWNDFLGPLLYLQRPEHYTLSLGLQAYQSQHGGTNESLLMAASVMIVIPIILLFFMAQRTFIQGIATTGVKG